MPVGQVGWGRRMPRTPSKAADWRPKPASPTLTSSGFWTTSPRPSSRRRPRVRSSQSARDVPGGRPEEARRRSRPARIRGLSLKSSSKVKDAQPWMYEILVKCIESRKGDRPWSTKAGQGESRPERSARRSASPPTRQEDEEPERPDPGRRHDVLRGLLSTATVGDPGFRDQHRRAGRPGGREGPRRTPYPPMMSVNLATPRPRTRSGWATPPIATALARLAGDRRARSAPTSSRAGQASSPTPSSKTAGPRRPTPLTARLRRVRRSATSTSRLTWKWARATST